MGPAVGCPSALLRCPPRRCLLAHDVTLVIIEFPTMDKARAWYDSQAYQALIPLRADH
ncbi:DUF1330 domain-containing protein, partial [Streptomyces hundungensis]